jgi:hypothetical protein
MELGRTQRSSRMLLGDFTVMMLSESGIYARFRNLEPKYTAKFCTLDDLAITLALYQCLRLRSSFRTEVLCGPRWWAGASVTGTWLLVCQKIHGKGRAV